mmetsp:Transcript_103416/g.299173  ORF Transcript_103416/g.299173 Transcript_103416/m.299173 type:complete len:335 (-) Transcript_103416:132-1136(-)
MLADTRHELRLRLAGDRPQQGRGHGQKVGASHDDQADQCAGGVLAHRPSNRRRGARPRAAQHFDAHHPRGRYAGGARVVALAAGSGEERVDHEGKGGRPDGYRSDDVRCQDQHPGRLRLGRDGRQHVDARPELVEHHVHQVRLRRACLHSGLRRIHGGGLWVYTGRPVDFLLEGVDVADVRARRRPVIELDRLEDDLRAGGADADLGRADRSAGLILKAAEGGQQRVRPSRCEQGLVKQELGPSDHRRAMFGQVVRADPQARPWRLRPVHRRVEALHKTNLRQAEVQPLQAHRRRASDRKPLGYDEACGATDGPVDGPRELAAGEVVRLAVERL